MQPNATEEKSEQLSAMLGAFLEGEFETADFVKLSQSVNALPLYKLCDTDMKITFHGAGSVLEKIVMSRALTCESAAARSVRGVPRQRGAAREEGGRAHSRVRALGIVRQPG